MCVRGGKSALTSPRTTCQTRLHWTPSQYPAPKTAISKHAFPIHFTSDSALIQMSYSTRVPEDSSRLSSQPGAGAEAGTRSPMPLPSHRSPQPPHPARTQPFVRRRHTPGPPHPGGDSRHSPFWLQPCAAQTGVGARRTRAASMPARQRDQV